MKKFLYLIPFFILNSCIDFADDDPYDLGRKIENNIKVLNTDMIYNADRTYNISTEVKNKNKDFSVKVKLTFEFKNPNPTINSETLTIDLKPNETKKSVFRSSRTNTNPDQMTYINKVKINVIHFDQS
ncbi:DUF5004 domain-containing protein [Empedobacter sp. UBA5987]|uniref:DUF5004 domain-containing protein n=1 Tax=Empedobacter sp. UBA5987 TaxID=1946444 RepID=UPI0025B8DFAE|nr:hypothetical protein [Empedobacter sp. UBA5987]